MSRGYWQVHPRIPDELLSQLSGELKRTIPPIIAQLLYNRGMVTAEDIDLFMKADERLLNDPSLLPDVDEAVSRTDKAIGSGEQIAIYGDFDADGITSTALLYQGLKFLGANVGTYIPRRSEEGYGLNNAAMLRLSKQGVGLVITTDCGVSAVSEVAEANRIGLDVIVTDHHNVPPEMPPAVAVVDPKRGDSRYPFSELAGVGVAYKFLHALFLSHGGDGHLESYLDLVALGTVADMVSLLGENRYLVKRGVEVLHNTERVGIIDLAKCAGIPISGADTETISWVLAPRLNAPGRLDHAGIGFRLLSTDSPEEAGRLAATLERKNTERQRLTETLTAKAKEQIVDGARDSYLVMVGGKDFHSGVIGVVAGRLAEEFYRPVVVFERGDKWTRGSSRSIPDVSIVDALSQCSDLLYRFGGHPMAAGFTVATERLEELRERLTAIVSEQLASVDIRPRISIDAEVRLADMSGSMFRMIQRLAPFGSANPPPVFLARNVIVDDYRCVGNNGDHLKLKVYDGRAKWDAIAFRMGNRVNELAACIDVVFNLQIDEWRGRTALQLNVVDFAPAA
ncbi:MAG: single-stranded-DNA-specific exonuclease RecJ [Chloroflexota bacterium]|nr:single-stranded-DNA-specific exonuclease RecJ [Chloroflexota bacterium]